LWRAAGLEVRLLRSRAPGERLRHPAAVHFEHHRGAFNATPRDLGVVDHCDDVLGLAFGLDDRRRASLRAVLAIDGLFDRIRIVYGSRMPTVGETLRSAREQRGLTIEQVSHDTRISARFIEALEADRHQELPAPVYVRGFMLA
jgi:hypothetical protein